MNRSLKTTIISFALILLPLLSSAIDDNPYVSFKNGKDYFPVVSSGKPIAIFGSSSDYPGVLRTLKDLQQDLQRLTGTLPSLNTESAPSGKQVIVAGTIGKSPLIDQLIRDGKITVSDIAGKWETFLIQAVDKPMPGVERALVIAGSDKRGTIFGIYDLVEEMGVSPWYWWADVPVTKQKEIYVLPGRHSEGEPKVKYRGIFINDEQPALGGWVRDNFGGFKSGFYVKVYELILRMKGNFLWPAMWGQSIYSDDPLSPQLADEYGIVISTSHHEPMMRAHVEWQREKGGAWNYNTNEAALREFWRAGIKRMGNNESIVTLAMRGDGDEPMSEESNVALLQKIVADQRQILTETTGKDITSIPQVWALYKEVQDYYDKGMRVPDDVTLLLCDDNWGNIRKLPKQGEKARAGGYGIYYHFDYVGGPRNYKWLNTNPIPRIWEQMNLAWEYGANRIWVVNVGDIKPMEFPIQFFLDHAWDPTKIDQDDIDAYTLKWVEQQFGTADAKEIASILALYAKYNSRRKPELLAPDTYSFVNYNEADRIVEEYNRLAESAKKIYDRLPAEKKDAYYQLIMYPVEACANLNALKVAAGKNHFYAKQGRAAANDLPGTVETLFARDAELADYYNTKMSGGKWNHMMDQTHISYTYWQQPPKDVLPETKTVSLSDNASMGVSIEGSSDAWPDSGSEATLPEFDSYHRQSYWVEVFNRGKAPFDYSVSSSAPWITVSAVKGKIDKQTRLKISVEWNKIPSGKNKGTVTINGAASSVAVNVIADNFSIPTDKSRKGFVEGNGVVSIDAVNYTKAVADAGIQWRVLSDLGRTGSAITSAPVTAKSSDPGGTSARLEYEVYLKNSGSVSIQTLVSPTIDFRNAGGLRFAISIDDEAPQIINIHADNSNRAWEKSVANNIIVSTSKHDVAQPGWHTVKLWRVDPAVVVQKIVVDTGGLKPSYLGPPESYHFK